MSIRGRKSRLHVKLDALKYAKQVFEAMDTPVSLGCYLRFKYREFSSYVEMVVRPSDYLDSESFFRDYQSVKLLSKYPYLETGIDTEAVAQKKFDEAEAACRLTNERFRCHRSEDFSPRVERVLFNAQRKIAVILGDVPRYEDMYFSFGPGAAYGVRGETSVYNKLTSGLECTYALAHHLREFLPEFPGWIPEGSCEVRLVSGSELSFVPKDAKTDRPICIEPLLNGLYQKGVGHWIRKRLRRFGVDLDDQSVNQRLASRAHIDRLATVDFSSASDTIAYNLVLDLLPWEWFEFLDVARSPRYKRRDGSWSNFHKFTSMGNAYTFELESLIFFALACACVEESGIRPVTRVNVSVYGDDVIIPQGAFDLFSEVSKVCGFTVNESKSFHDGLFFESCGLDYFDGDVVRPFQIKKRLTTLLGAFYATNTSRRLAIRLSELRLQPGLFDRRSRAVDHLRDLHSRCVAAVPRHLRAVGPEGYGDGHFVVNFGWRAHSTPSFARGNGWCGQWFRTYVEQPVKRKLDLWPLSYALYETRASFGPQSDDIGGIILREKRLSAGLSHDDQVDSLRALTSSEGYSIRGRTRVRRISVFAPSRDRTLIGCDFDMCFGEFSPFTESTGVSQTQ